MFQSTDTPPAISGEPHYEHAVFSGPGRYVRFGSWCQSFSGSGFLALGFALLHGEIVAVAAPLSIYFDLCPRWTAALENERLAYAAIIFKRF